MDNWDLPGQTSDENCTVHIWLHSPGVWNLVGDNGFLNYVLPRLQLQLALIFLVTQALHALFKRFYLPRMISEIMAGVILGKTVMGRLFPSFTYQLFPDEGDVFLENLAKIGFMFFMFLVGVKISAVMVFRTGVKPWFLGLCASVFPAIVSMGMAVRFNYTLPVYTRPTTKYILNVLSLTPFPVIAALLIDLKIMNSELGRLALASALISDFISAGYSLIQTLRRLSYEGWMYLMWINSLFLIACLFISIVFVMQPLCSFIIKQTPEGKPVKGAYIAFISSLVLVTSVICNNVGVQYHLGPFLLGLNVPVGPPLGSTLVDRLDTFISGLFTPLLMSFCALKVDLLFITDFSFLGTLWGTIGVLFVVKLISVFFPALLCKLSIRDAIGLSFIMCAQGIVQLALYDTVFKTRTLDDVAFGTGIVSTAVMATIIYMVVKFSTDYTRTYAGYQKRDILHTPFNAELRVLACSYRQDDAVAATKFLEVTNISKESPIGSYALNLIDLVGQAAPLLINHQLGQKVSVGGFGSRSQQMIEVFQRFQTKYTGLLNVQMFTAMSLPMFMHHDICSLAFDKLISIIILPFHRKWNQRGKLIFDNSVLRAINRQVLDNSPCSVGILIDRRKIRHEISALETVCHVGVVFLGGDDDREALALGKRMANSSNVHLTVVRIVARDDGCENQWDTILDTETLKDVKMQSARQGNVVYREEKAKEGPDTALIINAMAEAFDLIMVGRRHRDDLPLLSGLSEWNDLPELGPIGDILASSDIKKPVSVLVVQQQLLKNK